MKKKCTPVHSTFKVRCIRFPLLLIALFLTTGVAFSQVKVSGTVTDSKGAPVEGATVLVKGSTKGASTDVTGHFTINVPSSKSVLVVSSVGFQNKQETVGDRTVVNISLT